MSAETAVQGALYSALTALGLTVYDAAPQAKDSGSAADWPYVEIGAIFFTPFDTKTETGHDFTARIHTHSKSAGMKETKDIQGQIWTRLHRGSLTVTGHNFVLLQREQSDVIRASDGTFHGVCTYRGLIETA